MTCISRFYLSGLLGCAVLLAVPQMDAEETTASDTESSSFYNELLKAFYRATENNQAPGETSGDSSSDEDCPADTDCFTPDDFYEPPGCFDEPEDGNHACG